MTYVDYKEDDSFLGMISSDYLDDDIKYFKSQVEREIDKSVCMLYVYDGSDNRQDQEYLVSYHKLEFEDNPKNYKRKPLDVQYLIEGGKLNKEKFLIDLEGCIQKNDQSDDNLIYLTIDGIWTADSQEEVADFYAALKELGEKYNHKYIIRYILNELNREYINGLMLEHKYILLRRKDGLKTFRSKDLLSESMSTFSYYNEVEGKYEEEMMRVEHLKSMGELTEGIVHDVNNLFTTVLGCMELIALNGYKEENSQYINTIYKTVAEGSGIMNRVLSHMRGTKESERELHYLDDIVNFCLDMSYIKLKNLGNTRAIKPKVKLNSNMYINVNEYDIRQAILNIIFNAVDAMPDGGVLEVETYDEGDTAILSIKDNGMGMSVGFLDRIFDAYYTTKGDLGTGIGLNMTKKICDAYNIVIDVESDKGVGTEFKLSFPTVNFMED